MRGDSYSPLDATVDRAGFFRWGAKSIKSLTGHLIDIVADSSAKQENVVWSRLVEEKAVGTSPRLHFAKGKAFYVVIGQNRSRGRDGGRELQVFSGLCPEEGGLLEWREKMNGYYCPFCRAVYDRDGRPLTGTDTFLVRHEFKIDNGYVKVSFQP